MFSFFKKKPPLDTPAPAEPAAEAPAADKGGAFGWPFVARFAPLCLLVATLCGTAAGAAIIGWR